MYFFGPYNPKTNFDMHINYDEPTLPTQNITKPIININSLQVREDCPPIIEAKIKDFLSQDADSVQNDATRHESMSRAEQRQHY